MIRRLAWLLAVALIVGALGLVGAAVGVGLGYWYATTTAPTDQVVTTAGVVGLTVASIVLVLTTAYYARQTSRLAEGTRRSVASAIAIARQDRQHERALSAYSGLLSLLWRVPDWTAEQLQDTGSVGPGLRHHGLPTSDEFRRNLAVANLVGSSEVRVLLDAVSADVAAFETALASPSVETWPGLAQADRRAALEGLRERLLASIAKLEDRMRDELELE
jgi:hypothetical protein